VSALSIWFIEFLTLFEMMQIKSLFYINFSDDWIYITRFLFICVEIFLLYVVVKKYPLYRQTGSGMEQHLMHYVLEFMVSFNTIWLTTYIIDVSDEHSTGEMIVLVLGMVFIILFSIGVCIHVVCDIHCFHDKAKREEVLQKICDEIIAMNYDLTNFTFHPIIRSYHSDICVHMYDKIVG
jgi:hypothetical protein